MPETPAMTDIPHQYEVIGDHVRDAACLLVLAGNGQLYAFDLRNGEPRPTELNEEWVVDTCDLANHQRHLS